MRARDSRPLVVHVLYRFDVGGLENGVVNLINRMAPQGYRHAVVALTECVPGFAARLSRDDVQLISLHKPPGQGAKLFPRFYRLMRELAPSIVHTRNLAALEMVVPAAAARVPVRIHGEHGWEASDPAGCSAKFRLLRRVFSPCVQHYVALSGQLEQYLTERVGIDARRVARICNGVDAGRFHPPAVAGRPAGMPFEPGRDFLFGTVGRIDEVEDQVTLVRAFARLCGESEAARERARLVVAGDGPWCSRVEDAVRESGCAERIWLAGSRSDVPELMGALDCFVLPSLGEGISNTILEAMACGLPVVATAVGGNPELVEDGGTGRLVPCADPAAMAAAMGEFLAAPQQGMQFGTAARARIEAQFSLEAMVAGYTGLYDKMLAGRRAEAR